MKVCVTGGTGFTGAALVERLLDLGHEVKVLDKNPGIALDKLKQKGAQILIGSVTNRDEVKASVTGCEVVFHVAAAFRELNVLDSVYYEANVEATCIVAEESINAGARKLIYCSTQGVHGHIDNPPGDEESPIEPEDYYQQTKYEGEIALQEYKDQIEYCILRPTAIYGPGDPARYLMIYRRANKGKFMMFGNGETFYHPLYIDNLVDAFILSMEPGAGAYKAYIIGDEEYLSINNLVKGIGKALGINVKIPHYPITPLVIAGHICEKVCKPFGISPPIFPRRVDWFRQVRAFSIKKAKQDLGYIPKVGIDEGLRRTAIWYRENGYLN